MRRLIGNVIALVRMIELTVLDHRVAYMNLFRFLFMR